MFTELASYIDNALENKFKIIGGSPPPCPFGNADGYMRCQNIMNI